MMICPQCNSVYGDDFVYCSNDGTVLTKQNLPLPTEADDAEAETVIRREPFVVDFTAAPPAQAETVEINHTAPVSPQPIIVEKTSSSKFYALFLLVGLLLGGGLVLATMLAARVINRSDEANVAAVQTKTPEVKTQKTPESANAERDTEVDKIADELHQKRVESNSDEDFNGRVIVGNANVRSAPNNNATQVDILPDGDRLTIERRAGAASPWYYVTCEHGISGWMHGNTIEFTSGNF